MLSSEFRNRKNSLHAEGASAPPQATGCSAAQRDFARRSLSASSTKHRGAALGKVSAFTSFLRRKFYAQRSGDAARRQASQSAQVHWLDLDNAFASLVTERNEAAFWGALRNLGLLLTRQAATEGMELQLARERDQHLTPLQNRLAGADAQQLQVLAQILQNELASDGAHLEGNSDALLLLAEINVLVWDALKARQGLQEPRNIERASTAVAVAIQLARQGDLRGVMAHVEQMFEDSQAGVAALMPYAWADANPMVVAFWYALPVEPEQRALLLHALAPARAAALHTWLARTEINNASGARVIVHPENVDKREMGIVEFVARGTSSLGDQRTDAMGNFQTVQLNAQAAAVKDLDTIIAGLLAGTAEVAVTAFESMARHLSCLGHVGAELPQFLTARLESALKDLPVPELAELAAKMSSLVEATAQQAPQLAGAKACLVSIAQIIKTALPKRAEMEMQETIERSLAEATAKLDDVGKPESVVGKLNLLLSARLASACWTKDDIAEMRERGLHLIIDRLEELDLSIAKKLLVPLTKPDAEELLEAMNKREAKDQQHISNWWLQHMLLRGEISAEARRLNARVAEAGGRALKGEIVTFAKKMSDCSDALGEEDIRWPEHLSSICDGVVTLLCHPTLSLLTMLSDEDLQASLDLYRLGKAKMKEMHIMIKAEITRRDEDRMIARMRRIDAHGQKIGEAVTELASFLTNANPDDAANVDLIHQLAASEAALKRESDDLPAEKAVAAQLAKQLGQLSVAQWRVIEQKFAQMAQTVATDGRIDAEEQAMLAGVRDVLRLQAHDAALRLYEHVKAAHYRAKLEQPVKDRFEQLKPVLEQLPTSEEVVRAMAQWLNEMAPQAWNALVVSLPDAALADLTACASAQGHYAVALQERTQWLQHERALEAELAALVQALSDADGQAVSLPARRLRALIDEVRDVVAHYAARNLPPAEAIAHEFAQFCELAGSRRAVQLWEDLSDEDLQHLHSQAALQPLLAEVIKRVHQARVDELENDAASQGKEVIIAQRARMVSQCAPEIDADAARKWPRIEARMRALGVADKAVAGLDQGIRAELANLETDFMLALADQLGGLEPKNPTVVLFQQTVMAAAVAIQNARLGSDAGGRIAQTVTDSLLDMCAAPEKDWPGAASAAMALYFQNVDQSDEQKTEAAHPVVGEKVLSALDALTAVQLRQMLLRAPLEWMALFAKAGADTAVGKAYRWYEEQKILVQQLKSHTEFCIDKVGAWLGTPLASSKGALEAALLKLPLVLEPLQRMHDVLGPAIRSPLGRTLRADLPEDLILLLKALNKMLVEPNKADVASKNPVPLANIDKKLLPSISQFFIPFGYAEEWEMAVKAPASSMFKKLFNF